MVQRCFLSWSLRLGVSVAFVAIIGLSYPGGYQELVTDVLGHQENRNRLDEGKDLEENLENQLAESAERNAKCNEVVSELVTRQLSLPEAANRCREIYERNPKLAMKLIEYHGRSGDSTELTFARYLLSRIETTGIDAKVRSQLIEEFSAVYGIQHSRAES